MLVDKIEIRGVAGIKSLDLKLNNGLNVLCGTNGIGKTTILECIVTTFSYGAVRLKKNAHCEQGTVKIEYKNNESYNELQYIVTDFEPNSYKAQNYFQNFKLGSNVIYFKPHRDIAYQALNAVSKDPDYRNDEYFFAANTINGIKADDIKNWLINRYLFVDKKDSMSIEQISNYQTAIQCFNMMDSSVNFKNVRAASYEIVIETSKGDIYFEYLSAGYKSAIYILIGIIKEIEYRISSPYIAVKDFDGIILIDEIDVHLHPHWQSKLVLVLKELLPNAQIIATTHSPSILQVLNKEEIIPLEEDEVNGIRIKELNLGKYGLKGWTVEEILTDVMGLPSTSSDEFKNAMNLFDKAMEEEDSEGIKNAYSILNEMLHPRSNLRRLLKIQMAGLGD